MDIKNNCYILRQSNGNIYRIFYDDKKGIVYKIFTKGFWSEEEIVCENSINSFYAVLGMNDYIYLFCQDKSMNIVLCVYNNTGWNNKIIFFSKSNIKYSVNIKAALYKNDIHVFYTVPSNIPEHDVLIHQISLNGSEWSTPKPVDLLSFQNKEYSICQDISGNILAFYETGNEEFILGYKKYSVNSGIWSEFYTFDKNSSNFKDFSMIVKNSIIHSLYIKDENCNSILIYTFKNSKTSYSFTLSNTTKIYSCCLFLLDDNIWALWRDENGFYGAYSKNNGETFSIPKLYSNLTGIDSIKINLINNDNEIKKHILINEAFINNLSSFDILIISDIYPSINDAFSPESSMILDETADHIDSYLDYIKDQLSEIYEKLYLCKKQIREKEQQIYELTCTLEKRNEEIINLQYSLKALRDKLLNSDMSSKNFELRINSLEQIIKEKSKQIKDLSELSDIQKAEIENLNNTIKSSSVNSNDKSFKISFIKKFFNKI